MDVTTKNILLQVLCQGLEKYDYHCESFVDHTLNTLSIITLPAQKEKYLLLLFFILSPVLIEVRLKSLLHFKGPLFYLTF